MVTPIAYVANTQGTLLSITRLPPYWRRGSDIDDMARRTLWRWANEGFRVRIEEVHT